MDIHPHLEIEARTRKWQRKLEIFNMSCKQEQEQEQQEQEQQQQQEQEQEQERRRIWNPAAQGKNTFDLNENIWKYLYYFFKK